jgi:hypothetical protein
MRAEQLSPLRHCKLDDIHSSVTTLLAFLEKATQPPHFIMEQVHLKVGRFGPVFTYLANHAQHLNYLQLDDQWESILICFNSTDRPRVPSSSALNGPNKLTRTEDSCRCTIGYRLMRGRAIVSPQALKLRCRKFLLYGPRNIVVILSVLYDTRVYIMTLYHSSGEDYNPVVVKA